MKSAQEGTINPAFDQQGPAPILAPSPYPQFNPKSKGVTDHATLAKVAKPVQKSVGKGKAKPMQKSQPKQPPLGSGGRFQQLVDKLTPGDVADPAALAASIGRQKYGAQQMAKMAAAGKKKGR